MAMTGELFNTLTFGGVNSGDYGIYISGEGVFNAPARDVEMIAVPGRNGDIAMDLGRYENITVEYPAGMFGDDISDFRERFSDFRNAVLSQTGYQRLSDTYHPDEYRLGVYASGLDIAPVHYNEAGEFDLKFNCKPQRFLVEGEAPILVDSGDTITNPTLYDSSPIIKVKGYGDILVGASEIEIPDAQLGRVELKEAGAYANRALLFDTSAKELVNDGDTITVEESEVVILIGRDVRSIVSATITTPTDIFSIVSARVVDGRAEVRLRYAQQSYAKGGGGFNHDVTLRVEVRRTSSGSGSYVCGLIYVANDNRVAFSFGGPSTVTYVGVDFGGAWGDSSQHIIGDPTVIDCENGFIYKVEDDNVVSLSKYVTLGAELPRLPVGESVITYDNTITELEIIPRWWKL